MICGIVLFNPDIGRLKKCINAIFRQIDKIVLIDNHSDNIKDIELLIKKYKNIEIISNEQNMGIAFALNQILKYSIENNYKWFLTLDQDSVVINDLIDEYQKYIKLDNVAMICSNYIDDNTNEEVLLKENTENYTLVEKCITSGTLNNTEAINRCGGFDDDMFIDCVDFDMCASLIENNYYIVKVNFIGFHHTVGKSQIKKIFNKKIILYNESPLRLYYYVRNKLYFIKKHKKGINVLNNYFTLFKRLIIIMIFEKNKCRKFEGILKGIVDYKKNKMGKKEII